MALEGFNRIAWGTKLLLTAVMAVYCISLCPILKLQLCFLSLNECFNPPTAPHPLPPPAQPYKLNP